MKRIDKYSIEELADQFCMIRNCGMGTISGDGSYEKTKVRFVDGKFIGFEVHGHNIYDSNVSNNAHLSDERILNGSLRFYSVEKIYTCDLYNLKIFDQTDQSSGEEHVSLDVYWNGYTKMYK